MAYIIVKSDGSTLTTIANGTINTSSTSIALPGRNYAGYGEYLDTNFVHMLENFASSTVPNNALQGQLWFNTGDNVMYICPTDGEANTANWYAVTTTSSGGNATLGNLTVTGNLLANNITATNGLDANSISCNYLTVNVQANMANANLSGTLVATTVRTTQITAGSPTTAGTLTGIWTANGSGTAGGISGTSFYVTGGNLVVSNASSRGIVADNFYYSNGTAIPIGGGTYSNTNVAAYLPTYTGTVGATTATLRGDTLTAGGTASTGSVTGNWTLNAGSKWQANVVTDSAQPNITSVGVLTSLSVAANIVSGNVYANSGVIKAAYLDGDGSNISNISVAAGTSIVNGTSNVVVNASGNVRTSVNGTANVLVVASGGANISGYANITTNAFIGGNANVTSNVNAGNLNGILANLGTSNVRIVSAAGNVVTTANGVAMLTVTDTGANIGGYANVVGNLTAGNMTTTTVTATNANVSTIQNGTSNIRIATNSNVTVSVNGQSNVFTIQSSGAGANTVTINGNLVTSGFVTVGAIRLPNTDGTNGNVLTTYGNGVTYWGAGGGGGGVQTLIENGTSNVTIPTANSSVILNTGGATRITVTDSQAIFGVSISASGQAVTAGSLSTPLVRNTTSSTTNLTLNTANLVLNANTASGVYDFTIGTQAVYSNAAGRVAMGLSSGGFLAIGRTDGGATGTPFIDFYSSQAYTAGNYDARIQVSGNTASSQTGSGNMRITASNIIANGTFYIDTSQLISNIATGTAPFVVTSTTRVANLNVTTAGSADSVASSVTFNNGGSGAASGTTYNGSTARTISYNTIGAPAANGAGASGSWNISLANGTSNVSIPAASGNVNISVGGTSNVLVVRSTGANIQGNTSIDGRLEATILSCNPASAGSGGEIRLAANAVPLGTTTANAWVMDVHNDNSFRIFANITSFGGQKFLANADLNGNGNLKVTGNIYASQDIIAFSTSDVRLKENITPIENALDKIKKISGVIFDWKEGHEFDNIKRDTGVIAQEVEEVLPEVVLTKEDGYKAVRYDRIIGLVIEAIKELSEQVDELKKRT